MTKNELIYRLPMVVISTVLVRGKPKPNDPTPVMAKVEACAILNGAFVTGESPEFPAWVMPGAIEPTTTDDTWHTAARDALRELHTEVPPRMALRNHIASILGEDDA